MKVKICGLSRAVDIDYVNYAKPDYIGFVFAKSKRQVTKQAAKSLRRNLDREIQPIGVFVDQEVEFVAELLNEDIIDIAQLHGSEDNSYIQKLKALTDNKQVIKAFRIKDQKDIERARKSAADYLLLDAYSPKAAGGTGEIFNWELIEGIEKPFYLAGGISIENVQDAIEIAKPYCIDLSSSVETEGIKDRNKIIEIVSKIRSRNH